jgi:hypothetical protein
LKFSTDLGSTCPYSGKQDEDRVDRVNDGVEEEESGDVDGNKDNN